MTRIGLALALSALAAPSCADTLIAARTIRSGEIIARSDIRLADGAIAGALGDPVQAVGREARVILYAGRPIRPGDIGAPTVIERNQIVTLIYASGALEIAAEGRALGRAGLGDMLRVMNQSSRATVSGRVTDSGLVRVGGPDPRTEIDR